MGWKFVLDDGSEVDLDRLAPDTYDRIARTEPDSSWYLVYRFPGASTTRLWSLYVAACETVGAEPGDEPATVAETLALLDRLEQTADIEDEPMSNGYPPGPGAPETGLSSGAPENTDGLPT